MRWFQGGEKKGCYSDEAAVAKAVVAAATAAECAKGRPVPAQKMVEDDLAEMEEELLKVCRRSAINGQAFCCCPIMMSCDVVEDGWMVLLEARRFLFENLQSRQRRVAFAWGVAGLGFSCMLHT